MTTVSKAERQRIDETRIAREREAAQERRQKHEQQADLQRQADAQAGADALAKEFGPLQRMGQMVHRQEYIRQLLQN